MPVKEYRMNIRWKCLRYIIVSILFMGWTGYTWGQALLTFDEVLKNGGNSVGGLSGPTDVLMSPDSLYVYTVSSFGSEVGLFRRE